MSDYSFVEVMNNRNRLCNEMCHECPLSAVNRHSSLSCIELSTVRPKYYSDIVMKWAKEHPVQTNADKFYEVFGVNIRYSSSRCTGIDCTEIEGCASCEYRGFWEREYKKPSD